MKLNYQVQQHCCIFGSVAARLLIRDFNTIGSPNALESLSLVEDQISCVVTGTVTSQLRTTQAASREIPRQREFNAKKARSLLSV
jgi:hypothetical protein